MANSDLLRVKPVAPPSLTAGVGSAAGVTSVGAVGVSLVPGPGSETSGEASGDRSSAAARGSRVNISPLNQGHDFGDHDPGGKQDDRQRDDNGDDLQRRGPGISAAPPVRLGQTLSAAASLGRGIGIIVGSLVFIIILVAERAAAVRSGIVFAAVVTVDQPDLRLSPL